MYQQSSNSGTYSLLDIVFKAIYRVRNYLTIYWFYFSIKIVNFLNFIGADSLCDWFGEKSGLIAGLKELIRQHELEKLTRPYSRANSEKLTTLEAV